MRHSRALERDSTGFIPELHGLRGLALSLVVLFHLFGNGMVSGGVDVFLVISGFLLTRSLYGRLTTGQPESLRRHYSRTASRLVPPALVVILTSLLATLFLFPSSRWDMGAREAVASLLYFENWELINSQLTYEAAGPNASPFQHFWSLSIQGQFFIFWPLLVWVVVCIAQKLHVNSWYTLAIVTTTLTAISFAFALFSVGIDQQVAYFSTWTRFWQLGFGSLAGLILQRFPIPRNWKIPIAWGGLSMVLSGGFFLEASTSFPGIQAIWPCLGAIMVLAGSGSLQPFAPYTFLTARPIVFFANIAYPLYLWHWPLLVFYLSATNQNTLSFIGAVLILLVSIGMAYATEQYVSAVSFRVLQENGFKKSLQVAITSLALPALLISSLNIVNVRHQNDLISQLAGSSPNHPGALAGPQLGGLGNVPFRPSTDIASSDRPAIYQQGCVQRFRDGSDYEEALICQDTSETTHADSPLVVITGGSHAGQWFPAIRAIADSHGWELLVLEKGACRLVNPSTAQGFRDSCLAWNQDAQSQLIELRPDLVITVSTTTHKAGNIESMDTSQVSVWHDLNAFDIPVLAIRDTPRFDWSIPECIDENLASIEKCGLARELVFNPAYEEIVSEFPANVHPIDMTDFICTSDFCPAIIGNVLAYRDDNHITATFARSMAPIFEEKIRETSPHLF